MNSTRRDRQGTLLAITAAAVGTLVLLILISINAGSADRADRSDWINPIAADPAAATAIQVVNTQFVKGDPVTVVNLAHIEGRDAAPIPPGLKEFPAPGQVFLSPALAELMRNLPAGRLADRFPTNVHQVLGNEALTHPEQLMAVIGRSQAAPEVAATAGMSATDNGLDSRTVINRYSGGKDSSLMNADRDLALAAMALLIVPLLVLTVAAGQLGAARQERRLATLRLTGATAKQVATMTAATAGVLGVIGSLFGGLAYAALLPALAQWQFGVGDWFVSDLWVGLPVALLVLTAVPILTAAAAVAGLTRAIRSPLDAARESNPRATARNRLALFCAIMAAVAGLTIFGDLSSVKSQLALVVVTYCAFWIVGPWVTDHLGRLLARRARRPAGLLAARRLSDDPTGSWRTMSGLVMVGFLAGFFSLLQLDVFTVDNDRHEVGITSISSTTSTIGDINATLKQHGLVATVRPTGANDTETFIGDSDVIVEVPAKTSLDVVVTALSEINPAVPPRTSATVTAADRIAAQQFEATALFTLILGFLIAGVSAGTAAAAALLDKRRTYRQLHLMGAPIAVMNRARLAETALPLAVLVGGTTTMGLLAAWQVNGLIGASADAISVLKVVACLTAGGVIMMLSVTCSTPLLRAVAHEDEGNEE